MELPERVADRGPRCRAAVDAVLGCGGLAPYAVAVVLASALDHQHFTATGR